MLELLVAKRAVKTIYYTRLPTGHTHEDIDAIFGVIWSWFCTEIVHTPDEFKTALEEAFKGHSSVHLRNIIIEDVFVVPDYQEFLGPHILPISRLHTLNNTMHQWRFEAVQVSPHFPLGCKTCYRAYSSDKVIEIIKRPRELCSTPIGQLTGLEPVTTYVRWEPNPEAIESRRGVEGIYILKSMPVTDFIPPAPFDSGFAESLEKLKATITSKFELKDLDLEVRKAWYAWFSDAPTEPGIEGSMNYIKTHVYRSPLLPLFQHNGICKPRWSLGSHLPPKQSEPVMQWPSSVAFAMPSVVTTFNPTPPDPRFYVVSNETASNLERFRAVLETRYMQMNSMTGEQLKSLLRYDIS